jgi:hypothetical protein
MKIGHFTRVAYRKRTQACSSRRSLVLSGVYLAWTLPPPPLVLDPLLESAPANAVNPAFPRPNCKKAHLSQASRFTPRPPTIPFHHSKSTYKSMPLAGGVVFGQIGQRTASSKMSTGTRQRSQGRTAKGLRPGRTIHRRPSSPIGISSTFTVKTLTLHAHANREKPRAPGHAAKRVH